MLSTELLTKHQHTKARSMRFRSAHGEFVTPCFMPVGTYAAVNCLSPESLRDVGSQIILGGNTYHMLVSPGMDIIQQAGGMHPFMQWSGPMLTDSGGFQVFSLSKNSKICKIDENGAHFRHPVTNQLIHLTPKTSINAQKIIGADIIMAFDQCTPEVGGREAALKALDRTHRWLLEAIELQQKNPHSAYGYQQALFGIIQGGSHQDLREQSAEFILAQPLDGIAIGGEVIGFDMAKTLEILSWLEPGLPEDKLRYTMGVGLNPEDLIQVVGAGVDIFDCVAPTRNARHGALYHGDIVPAGDWFTFKSDEEDKARLHIKKGKYANDHRPISETCDCHTCQHYTRAYLHYLFRQRHPNYLALACCHNIRVMHRVCDVMRAAISA